MENRLKDNMKVVNYTNQVQILDAAGDFENNYGMMQATEMAWLRVLRSTNFVDLEKTFKRIQA